MILVLGDVHHSSGAWPHELQQKRLADELHEQNHHEQGENQVLSQHSYISFCVNIQKFVNYTLPVRGGVSTLARMVWGLF